MRLVTNPQVVQLARNASADSLFIDLEHSTLSLNDASTLCITGLNTGITPFVRVPHQCGNGFIQKVLDGGAMGVIFPHVTNASRLKTYHLNWILTDFITLQRKQRMRYLSPNTHLKGVDP